MLKATDFNIKPNRDTVFHLIDCYPNSPVYQEVVEEFESLKDEVYSLMEPVAILQFAKLNSSIDLKEYEAGTSACYVLMTIGMKIAQLSSHYFDKGNYLAGMLVNAMADDYLFQLDREVEKIIQEQCLQRHSGVIKRLEVPADIPMEAQKVILEETGAAGELNMGITEGYMFTTVKTNCYILILTENENILNTQHDCKKCEAINCKTRKPSGINIEVIREDHIFTISCI